jgi:hypothetical protein
MSVLPPGVPSPLTARVLAHASGGSYPYHHTPQHLLSSQVGRAAELIARQGVEVEW